MERLLFAVAVLLAGMMLPVQAGMNARLGKGLESPIWGAAISFVVGALGLIGFALVTRQQAAWENSRNIAWHLWLSGLLGAFYVTTALIALPRLGAAFTFALVITGQLFISLVLDHFGLMVQEQHPVNWWRVLGVLLIVGGVVLIRNN